MRLGGSVTEAAAQQGRESSGMMVTADSCIFIIYHF